MLMSNLDLSFSSPLDNLHLYIEDFDILSKENVIGENFREFRSFWKNQSISTYR